MGVCARVRDNWLPLGADSQQPFPGLKEVLKSQWLLPLGAVSVHPLGCAPPSSAQSRAGPSALSPCHPLSPSRPLRGRALGLAPDPVPETTMLRS